MATFLCYGNFNGKYGDKFSYDILYDILEQNIAGNYSRVRFYGYIRSWGYTASGTTSRCYINGQQIATFTSISKDQYSQMGYLDVTVNHNADGTGSIAVTGLCDTPWTLGDASCSGTLTLPTIPRASSVTCTDGNIESSVSININRASDSFTHTLRYAFGSLSGTIATGVGTSYGWTLPTGFYAQIPNSKSGVGTIYCDTYSNGTLIGTSSCNFNAYTDESKCKPTVTATIVDSNSTTVALTGDNNKLVKFVSNAKITINATAKNSASISNRTVTCSDGKSGNGTEVTLNKVESGNFTVSATDSRGYTTSITISKTLIDYVILTMNPTFYRPEPTTREIVLNLSGNYFSGSFGSTNNSLTVKYRYKESGGTYSDYQTATVTIANNTYFLNLSLGNGFDYQKSYDFEIVVTDKLNTITKTAHVSEGIPILALFKDHLEAFGQDLPVPYILYKDDSGSDIDIILNDSKENYNYIEIFYQQNDGVFNSKKILVVNGTQRTILDGIWQIDANGSMQFETRNILLSGTNLSMEFTQSSYININYAQEIIPSGMTQNTIKIYKVLGYK